MDVQEGILSFLHNISKIAKLLKKEIHPLIFY